MRGDYDDVDVDNDNDDDVDDGNDDDVDDDDQSEGGAQEEPSDHLSPTDPLIRT